LEWVKYCRKKKWDPLNANSGRVMVYADYLREHLHQKHTTIGVHLTSINSIVTLFEGTFDHQAKAVQLLLKGMQKLEGLSQEGATIIPSHWG
jgi:hypothetical protein